jgi:hypothetical protein
MESVMFFALFVPTPEPIVLPPVNTLAEIRLYYDRQLEQCRKCRPFILRRDGTVKALKPGEVMKYLERRHKLYAQLGIDM